ncbi:trichohyalin-like protein 1 [Erpetoichthys calabaricus]|uniref:trichohyalin-like protein 1 n=1 Tax=Erpetoichthys calabaricus TaxID=27687 RepID=UPI002233F927|nr:trichohyalin-like protein 1 [Erpetoichthys calabaricus]
MSHPRRTPPPAAFCCDPLCMFGLGSGIGSFRDELSGLWMEWARRHHFAVWQSYVRSSAWAALNHEHGPEITQPREGGEDWRVSLDVKQFSPEEVTIQTNGDHLAISAKHEERQDEDGLVSRNFLWKYKLPVGVDIQGMQAYMSPSGVLIITAPLPKSAHKAPKHTAIQIKVEKRLYEQYSQPGEGQGEDLVKKPLDHPDLHDQFTAREKEGPSLTEQHEKRMEDPSVGLDITDDPAEQEVGPGAFKKNEGAPAEQQHTLSSGPLDHIEQQDPSISEEGHDLNAEKEDPYAPGEQEGGSSTQQDPPVSEEQKDRHPEQHDSLTSGEQEDVNTAQHDTVASEENQNIQPEQQDQVDCGPLGDTQGSQQVPPNSEEQGKMEDKDPLTSDEKEDKKSTQQDPTTSVEVEDTKSTEDSPVSGEVEDKQTMQQDPLASGEQVDTHVMQEDSATPGELEDTRFTKQNHEGTLVEEQDPLTSAEQEDAYTVQQDPFPLGKVHAIPLAEHNLLAFGEQENIQAVKEDLTATEEEVGASDPRMQKEVLSEQWDPFESGDQDDAQISKQDLHASEGEDDKHVTQDPVFSGEQDEIQSTEVGLPDLEQDDTQALLEGSIVSEGQEDSQILQDSLVFEKQDRMPATIVDAEGSRELEETEPTEHDPAVCKQKEDTQEKHQDPFTAKGQEGIPQDPSATRQQEDAPSGQWDLPSLHKLGEQGDQSASAEQPGPFAFGEHEDEQMTQQEPLTLVEDENTPDILTSGEQGIQVVQQDPPVMEEHDDICDECQGPTSSGESEDIQAEQKPSKETEDTTLEHQHPPLSGDWEDAQFVQEDPFGSGEKEENLTAMSKQEERQDTPQDPSPSGGQGEAEGTQQDPPISGKQEETLTLQRDQLASEEQGDSCIRQDDQLTVDRAAQTE